MNMDIFATVSIWPCPCDSSLSAHIPLTKLESMFQRSLIVAESIDCVLSLMSSARGLCVDGWRGCINSAGRVWLCVWMRVRVGGLDEG